MISSLALMSIYKSPIIPLSEICDRYLSLSIDEALKRASRAELPFPTFRISQSRKAPLMVLAEDLGAHIDKTAAHARTEWERAQS